VFDRDAVNYAKWQLLHNELNQFAFAMEDSSWEIFRKNKYRKSSKLDVSDKLACAQFVQNSMPLAVARPFVEEFITRNIISIVSIEY